jgi:hypothetical protein
LLVDRLFVDLFFLLSEDFIASHVEVVERPFLEMGDLENPGGAWLMMGIAQMELGDLQEARRAFKQAQQFDDKVRRQARDWEKFVEDRMQVASR